MLLCRFEREFLAVPPECLILTMKANQKYFPLLDADGRLTQPLPHRQQHPPGRPQPRRRGQRARGAAAPGRRQVLLRPGPQEDARIARAGAGQGGLPRQARHARASASSACAPSRAPSASSSAASALAAEADRAALLAKADLLTDMVGEFPELQGIMGGYYARHDGETEAVALRDRRPLQAALRRRRAAARRGRRRGGAGRQAGDAGRPVRHRPGAHRRQGPVRAAPPCAGRDPHADRARPAAGGAGAGGRRPSRPSPPRHGQAQAELCAFLYDRLAGYLRELGYSAQEVDAVLALRPERWAELPRAAGGGARLRRAARGGRRWPRPTSASATS